MLRLEHLSEKIAGRDDGRCHEFCSSSSCFCIAVRFMVVTQYRYANGGAPTGSRGSSHGASSGDGAGAGELGPEPESAAPGHGWAARASGSQPASDGLRLVRRHACSSGGNGACDSMSC